MIDLMLGLDFYLKVENFSYAIAYISHKNSFFTLPYIYLMWLWFRLLFMYGLFIKRTRY